LQFRVTLPENSLAPCSFFAASAALVRSALKRRCYRQPPGGDDKTKPRENRLRLVNENPRRTRAVADFS
jgi:hypothetical protein